MSVEEFDNGYFYAADMKVFFRSLGLAVGNLVVSQFEISILIGDWGRKDWY